MEREETAGELCKKALEDTTVYKAEEVGRAMCDDIEKHLYKAIENYVDRIDQDKFCVVMLIGKDSILPNLIRRKFYCWPFLPKPRPNQAVFLYEKGKDRITKRLWVLPCDAAMAELASLGPVHKVYKNMQKWSKAFFSGNFWDFIRSESKIDMKSEYECLQEVLGENGNLCVEKFSVRERESNIVNSIEPTDVFYSQQVSV